MHVIATHGCKSSDISALETSLRRRSSSPHPPNMALQKEEKRGKLNAEGCRPEGRGEVRQSVGAGLRRVDKKQRERGDEASTERGSMSQNVG